MCRHSSAGSTGRRLARASVATTIGAGWPFFALLPRGGEPYSHIDRRQPCVLDREPACGAVRLGASVCMICPDYSMYHRPTGKFQYFTRPPLYVREGPLDGALSSCRVDATSADHQPASLTSAVYIKGKKAWTLRYTTTRGLALDAVLSSAWHRPCGERIHPTASKQHVASSRHVAQSPVPRGFWTHVAMQRQRTRPMGGLDGLQAENAPLRCCS